MAKNTVFFLIFLFIFAACQYQTDNPQQSSGKTNAEKANTEKDDYTLFELGRFEGLEKDTEWQILQAYLEKLQSSGSHADLTINDVWIEQYYGSYCPTYLFPDLYEDQYVFIKTEYKKAKNRTVNAVRIGAKSMDYGTEQRDVIINIFTPPALIRYYDRSAIFLWDKGHLYDIEKDYDREKGFNIVDVIVTYADLRKIINRHNGLDFETDAMIRETIGKYILTGWSADEYDFMSIKYLGSYNGYTAIILYEGYQPAVMKKIIGDVLFDFPSRPNWVFAWKEGEIYELDDLYEQGLITREDLVEMAYFHSTAKRY